MSFYFYYQQTSESVWIPALADERANIIRDKHPALATVLDVDSTFEEDMSAEQRAAVKHRGCLYFDIDSEDIETAIEQTKKLLTLIQSKGVSLNMLRMYLSGKKGFHILVDPAIFMPKVNQNGVCGLPAIYREMVWSNLYVDDVDMRVFSSGRGRMLRCPNVKRKDNGAYKVSVSPDEIMSLTPERYAELCSSPRNELPVEPPKFCPELGLAYSVASDKVSKAVARRKSKKKTDDSLARFGKEWPETLKLVTSGVGLREDVGFNSVAMQVAITGNALGLKEDQIIADCAGLIENHKGDSSRYGTPAKRRAFLRQMVRYCEDNPLYEFSVGGVLSLLIPEVRANADIALGEYVPDTPAEPVINEDGTVTQPVIKEDDPSCPLKISKAGIYVRTETGFTRVSDIGLGKAVALKNMDMTSLGYEVEVFKHDKPQGTTTLPLDKLSSRAAFQSWTSQWSASMAASDIQTAKIMDVLSKRSENNGDVVFVVTREGVDLVVPRGAKSEDDFEIIWSCPEQVIGSRGGKYRFRSPVDKGGTYRSDLMEAPELSIEDADLIRNLLHMNTTANLGKLLGWFSAAFLCQIIRRFYGQFPSLQCFGQAGAGKSQSVALLNNMHYYMQPTKESQASGNTIYPMIVNVASSASQPVIFEEVKQREMNATLRAFLLNLFRSNYNGHHLARGALTKDVASKDVTVNTYANSGPILFVGESVESQSAILERCVIVSLAKQDRYGKSDAFHYVAKRRTELGKLGKAMVTNVMSLDTRNMRRDFDAIFEEVKAALGAQAEEMERPTYNIAVVVMGLKLLKDTLHGVFGSMFDERLDEMRASIVNNVSANIPVNMSEASRVLDVMAQLSRNSDVQYQMVRGADYTIAQDGKTMDLKLRNAYTKYIRWQRSLGQEVLFDNESAFIAGMSNYAGTVKRACPENEQLFDSPRAIIYRLDLAYLEKEGVDSFKA